MSKLEFAKGLRVVFKKAKNSFFLGTVTAKRVDKVYIQLDNGEKLTILANETRKVAGVGVAKQFKNEITDATLSKYVVADKPADKKADKKAPAKKAEKKPAEKKATPAKKDDKKVEKKADKKTAPAKKAEKAEKKPAEKKEVKAEKPAKPAKKAEKTEKKPAKPAKKAEKKADTKDDDLVFVDSASDDGLDWGEDVEGLNDKKTKHSKK